MNRATRRSVLKFGVVVLAMFGFGFALVPIYNALCDAIGLNGKIRMEATAADTAVVDRSRLVTVEFVTTINGGGNWEFRSEKVRVQVHPGEMSRVDFRARNPEDRARVAQAVPNVAPMEAARHLRKAECFCFNQQPFGPGEEKQMPMVFVIDPALPKDVDTVTLSYTFFDVTEHARAGGTVEPKI